MKQDFIRLREMLVKGGWSRDTAYRKRDYTPELPSKGQCYVTALLINDAFGGVVITGKLKNGEIHYWNIVDGEVVDLTSDQYGGDGYHTLPPADFVRVRETCKLNFQNERFRVLLRRLDEIFCSQVPEK